MEKTTLEVEKTELFIQAADPWLQEKLESLLEDRNEEHGLKSDWRDVEGAVSLLTKRQRRRDKPVVSDVKLEMSPTMHNPSSSKPLLPAKVEDSAMDELIKGMRELKLKLAKLEGKGQVSAEPTSKPKHDQTTRRMPLPLEEKLE
jgi:hypothetical protein